MVHNQNYAICSDFTQNNFTNFHFKMKKKFNFFFKFNILHLSVHQNKNYPHTTHI